MPAPMNSAPRCSRTPCQTNQAPPISARAARPNSTIERMIVMVICQQHRRYGYPAGWPPRGGKGTWSYTIRMSCSEGVQAASYCYIVALSIDVDAPFLRPSELRTLVCAVRDATGQDEHAWIDWQVGLDVTTTAGVAYVAKQILGFANRDPAEARRRAGGYAYLLVGVAPGSLAGSNEVDPAALVDQVRHYVGDVIRWTPEQVVVEGVEALIIVVDPPRSGDPIHCLHKQLHNFPPGTVFVRHTGRTEPASVADMEMLQRRLLDRTPGLELSVTAQPSTIEPIPDFARFVNDWAAEQKPR